jgi:hypothetical protein
MRGRRNRAAAADVLIIEDEPLIVMDLDRELACALRPAHVRHTGSKRFDPPHVDCRAERTIRPVRNAFGEFRNWVKRRSSEFPVRVRIAPLSAPGLVLASVSVSETLFNSDRSAEDLSHWSETSSQFRTEFAQRESNPEPTFSR